MEDALINAQAFEFLLSKEGHKSNRTNREHRQLRGFGSNYAVSR